MKPSTLAVALLTASLGAVTNAQHVGGGAQYKRVKTIRGSASSPRARLVGDADESELLDTCTALSSSGNCNENNSCTWCVAGAVPSACYPTVMASQLPAGVFQCSTKTAAKADFAEAAASIVDTIVEAALPEEKKVSKKVKQTFNLKEGVTLTLDTAEVDKDFCDASSPLSLAGYMNVKGSQFDTDNDKNLFYWFFEKRTTSQLPAGNPKLESGDPKKKGEKGETPLVIWLTGGPGCSSSLALLSENGPCSVETDGATTKVNPYSWTESANVLWLDQPADVGYSYGQGNDSNEEMISEDAYYFLQAWFKSDEGEKYKNSPLFIVGESYGGHYAPAIAHRILEGNKKVKKGLAKLNLKGLAVGNGLTDPEEQYKWYAEMAYNNSHDDKVISEQTYKAMTAAIPLCTKGIKECNKGDNMLNSFACQGAFMYCNTALTTPYRATGKNPYDMSKDCPPTNPLCYDFSHVEKFMNLDTTKKALHVDEHNPTWKTCNMMINMSFHVDWMKNFAPYVKDLVNAGIPALIYAGDLDFVCNYLGNREWTLKLDWKHHDEFNAAEEHDWNSGAGLARTSNGLTFLQVYDAGHMVPADQPEHALQMITQFLNGEVF
mmetsp:Transcript_6680/g.11905  ORF Transcript_6680/g.11905 Transcript_6680/m.11905 type:complete len:605 (+) Transcript_6680:89-1903(+)|eukprot:CAMPEP_0201880118 /NCGR_PEP_ID=MMETSP0902-20130614/10807_1 /ASSEMBLY_ACC=CAM_ASM_000551 /TAXON_ID=420261 /ORGANISM="Thalassiosira antarctica, Strain CCMP982" /LENGTH=604 /DNA_ID=CAMNT_0048408087 /DNA_START=22 /DNA_END=1836 /DNA_ORIENTATION=-